MPTAQMFLDGGFTNINKVLIANRGEIACRIIRSCKELGLTSVGIYTPADRSSAHVKLADEVWLLPGSDQSGYIQQEDVLEIARKSGAHAVIPGYGFLSENDQFAEKVEQAGMTWVGPSSRVITQFGLKHTARELAIKSGVPVIQGTDLLQSAQNALDAAKRIGYPVMLKATAGGGGMGLQICHEESEIEEAFRSVEARGATLFKNTSMFMEKYVAKSRHVEVQVFGNGMGGAVHFGERECSIQRRHQKVVEECPSPFVESRPGMREKLTSCAVALASNVGYSSAGTVEFLVDDLTGEFYFLEMNTRLQVEHGITELCYDVDLVSLMLQQAEMQSRGKGGLDFSTLQSLQKSSPTGYAIEARVYAEIPTRNFAPSPGLLQHVDWYSAPGVRIDTWIRSGTNISPFYDPMIAKVIVWDRDSHDAAVDKMLDTLRLSKVQGCPTNFQYLAAIVSSDAFKKGDTTTAFLTSDSFHFEPTTIDVISGGAYTTVQDWPARRGVGNGVPESGPLDSVSFRLANILVGNEQGVEGLEITLVGPELLFHAPAIIAITGGTIEIAINGEAASTNTRLLVPKGATVKLGRVTKGCRSYLAVKGGFPSIPQYLGSKSTTTTLKLGGYQGRQLVANDSIDLDPRTTEWAAAFTSVQIPAESRLDNLWTNDWDIFTMPGPHDEPYFTTEQDRDTLYNTTWKISHNATRSGYKLVGPNLGWAREDGGEGGSHPANVIDEPYPYGGLNWNGDDPVILPIDAPMAGGLATTSTIVRADFWRLGQCRPGDTLRLKRVSWDSARELRQRTEAYLVAAQEFIASSGTTPIALVDINLPSDWSETILHRIETPLEVVFRQSGDSYLHVTYGPMTSSALTRAHIQYRVDQLAKDSDIVAIITATRSYSVQFDPLVITQLDLLKRLIDLEHSLGSAQHRIPSRVFNFPILLDDPLAKAAVQDYMNKVRDSAVYLPDNAAYIARANGVDNTESANKSILACRQLVTEVSFLAGTPLMLPLDPRLVYVAQKYNPVRAFTAEGTVGLGGPLSVIYPLDAPGGYQIRGRTLTPWDAFASRPGFTAPWLLRDFDQIQFFEVDEPEFDRIYDQYKSGRYTFDVEETFFDPEQYAQFLASIRDETEAFTARRDAAGKEVTQEERRLLAAWRESQAANDGGPADDEAVEGGIDVVAPMPSSVWKIKVAEGDTVKEGDVLAILEAMKMEIPIRADASMGGKTVRRLVTREGSLLDAGQSILIVA